MSLLDRLIFEVPVYRTTHEAQGHQIQRLKEQARSRLLSWWPENVETEAPEIHARAMRHIDDRFYRGGWRYNQLVGWMQIRVFGRQVRADYWKLDAQRVHWNTSNKRFEKMGKAFEFHTGFEEASEEILAELRSHLELAGKNEFSGRYIDLEAFESVAPFIDWRALVEDDADHPARAQ